MTDIDHRRQRLDHDRFLWHMAAYLVAVLLLWPLGFGWLERPLWIAVPGLLLAALVALFGRFETQRRRRPSG